MGQAPPAQGEFKLSSLFVSVYLPTILFSIGQGAVIPIIPLFAKDLGASVALASFTVALRGIGQIAFDLPGGVAISKYGDKFAMVGGTAMIGVVAIGAAFSPSPLVLCILILIMGGGWAMWMLARLAYVSEVVPLAQRGRALSMVGGMNRVGNFIGPVIGGFLGNQFGLESAFFAQAFMGLLASVLMFAVVKDIPTSEHMEGHGLGARLAGTVVDHRGVLLTAGPPVVILGLLRQARTVFLPLWGDSIGLDVAQIGVLTSLSFFIDAAVFYPVGTVMDRWGRKWVAVPCLFTLALGLALLPLTNNFTTFMGIAMLTGLGNGFGAGIVMTLGADFAPEERRGEFLGVWRLIGDLGQAGGPLFISIVTGLGSLTAAAIGTGGIGFVGAAMMLLLVKETLVRHKPLITKALREPD